MVQFAATLQQQRNEDWKEYYIDYHGLKKQLKSLKAAYEAASTTQKHHHDLPHGTSLESAPTSTHEGAVAGWSRRGSHGSSPYTNIPQSSSVSGGGGGGGGGMGGATSVMSCASLTASGGTRSLRRRLTSSYSLVVGEDVDELEEQFKAILDSEVEKVVLFFLSKQGELARLLLDARHPVAAGQPPPPPQQPSHDGASNSAGAAAGEGFFIGGADAGDAGVTAIAAAGGSGGGGGGAWWVARETDRHQIYCSIGRQIAELMRFLRLNVSGLRKILKKHDKQVRDKLIAKNYLSTRAEAKYSSMRQLYNNAGVMALVGSLRNAFEAADAEQTKAVGHWVDEERGLRTTRAGDRTLSEFSCTEGVLVEIANEQRALAEAQHLTTSKYLSLQVLLDGSGLSSVDEGSEQESTNRELHRPSAFINLATTFLYMTNYYIVGPTSAEYAAALGGSPAVSGLIIGMTPIAACFSCLLYSWWTNTSFRGPLLLCSVLLIVGNFLYGLALSYDAFWMVLVGRMLIGLGGARGVNRRYIADTIPIIDRTAYSAAFVAAGAVGMAFGPALSAVFNEVDFTVAGITFNGLTNPGWIMFVLWVVMGAIIQYEFQEPPHYMSNSSEVGSDEDPSAANTPVHDRLSIKRAAIADESSTPASAAATAGGAYGATTTTTTTKTAALAPDTEGSVRASGPGNGTLDSHESAKLLGTVAPGVADEGVAGEDGVEDDGEYDSGADFPGGGGKMSSGAGGGGGGLGAITPPLGFCLFGYFVNKLITEAVVSSAPVLTQYLFDWSVQEVGMLMAVLGIVVLPVNAMVGRMSMAYEDRVLLQALAALACVGSLVIVDFKLWPFEYTEAQYIAGVSLVFVAMQAHEGVVMSVTSKIIPVQLARGTWNSGFLATEAGTFGRFVGDAFITVLGVMTLSWLDFLLFFPSALLVVVMMIGFWLVYPFLQGQ